MKIAYLDNKVSELLIDKKKIANSKEIIGLNENEIEIQILNGNLKLALIDPLIYSKLKKKKDLRVIPQNPLFFEDFTNTFSINITHNHKDLDKLSSHIDSSYIYNIAKIVLSERYDISISSKPSSGGSELKLFESNSTLDLSEDWFESFKIKLPIYFWVVIVDEENLTLEEYQDITNNICFKNDEIITSSNNEREGRIVRNWEEDAEDALDNTLEVLFYQNATEEIHACKIYNLQDILEENSQKTE